MNRFQKGLLGISQRGYKAREQGLTRIAPYRTYDNLGVQRAEHWLAGYDEAHRKLTNPRGMLNQMRKRGLITNPDNLPVI